MKKIEPSILILGDSTSSTIGLERKTHHMLLADKKMWPYQTIMLNCSMPGMTSADALAYYRLLNRKQKKSIKLVFLYLGNCDSIAMEATKGYYSYLKHLRYLFINRVRKRNKKFKLKNKLLYFEWNKSIDLAIENPETPQNFKKNLNAIYKVANKFKSKVILIKPEANKFFLPGIGKGNFVFYKFIGIKDKISTKIDFPDLRLKRALHFHEESKFSKAFEMYKEILDNPFKEDFGNEYNLMILNNSAVAKAENGKLEESKFLIQMYLDEKYSRKEIGYYNLAQVENKIGNKHSYEIAISKSFEADFYLYRVREPYQRIVDEIAEKFNLTSIIDMSLILNKEDYLDHCHPLPEGQIKLAKAFEVQYKKNGFSGNYKAEIVNDLYNPELANGNFSSFTKYFKTNPDQSNLNLRESFNKYFNLITSKVLDEEELFIHKIPLEIHRSYKHFLKHPLFTSSEDLNEINFFSPTDIGRFPENFLYRYLANILEKIEKESPSILDYFNQKQVLVHSSNSFKRILNEQTGVTFEDLEILKSISFNETRIKNIIKKIKELVIEDLEFGNQINTRMKTTIYWYFRETLRFGSHSRYSMLYNRVLYENICESIAVMYFFNQKNKLGFDMELNNLKDQILKLIDIHDYYCQKYRIFDDSKDLLKKYDFALRKIKI